MGGLFHMLGSGCTRGFDFLFWRALLLFVLRAVAGACVGRRTGQPRMPPQERLHEGLGGLGDCSTCPGVVIRRRAVSGERVKESPSDTGATSKEKNKNQPPSCRLSLACETISRIISGMTRHSANRRRT